ncbi:MAG: Cysteine--tRNA ligase [bacterium]|nr:Cysteine--tRNA ligase [bacterium]
MLQFFNTLTRRKEPFTPLVPGVVSIYNCGPTVYDFVHIGNWRTFLFADLLVRYLEYRGFEVRQVMNITDVGHMLNDDEQGTDRMALASEREQLHPLQVAARYTEAFLADAALLDIHEPLARPKATDYVPQMIAMVESLLEKGFAYEVNNSVYFDVSKFAAYGQLSNQQLDDLQAGARIEPHPDKRHPFDFALWIHNPQHVLQWETPWGSGYPGWHIECSSMIEAILGPTIDIHTGGEDNIFPHHECEIAQSTSAHDGAPLAHIWMHARFLLVDGEKMSKSKGNFYRLVDLMEKGFEAKDVRYALLAAHYRSTYNFTLEGLEAARATRRGLNDYIRRLETAVAAGEGTRECERAIQDAKDKFEAALDDDLNITEALEAIFGLRDAMYKRLAKGQLQRSDAQALIRTFREFDDVLRIMQFTPLAVMDDSTRTELQADIAARQTARLNKEWGAADLLRDKWAAQGVVMEDIQGGTRWISDGGEAGIVEG